MTERFVFDNEHAFLDKLRELVGSGIDPRDIDYRAPHPVHPAEEILRVPPSRVRVFALVGGLLGAATGYGFTSFTALDWPLWTAGKPLVSIPAYTIIAFELMVLFGSLASFAGMLWTSRMPAVRTILSDDEFDDAYVIQVKRTNR